MNSVLALVLGVLSLTSPFITGHWSSSERDSVAIRVPGLKESVEECLLSGRQARIRFELRLCRKRVGWFDHCESPRSELHTVEFDGITETYRIVSDRFGDIDAATAVGVASREEAIREALKSDKLPLAFLARDESTLVGHSGAYLSARSVFRCKGSSSRTFAHLSRFLTLGVLNVVESRSDWHEFALFPNGEGATEVESEDSDS